MFKKPFFSRVCDFKFLLTAILFLFSFFICLFSCKRATQPIDENTSPDTTSHNFTWIIDTIGTQSSYFLDVAIINQNDIWAVGEIHLDSEIDSYNAVHWNGTEWELHHIPAVTYWGDITKGPIYSVFTFNSNDVWMFSKAGSYAHWNGLQWKSEFISQRVGTINRIWGNSSNNMYFIGTNGNITLYDGDSWQQLDSGTDIDIQDIWGAVNPKTGKEEILAIASLRNYGRAMELLKIDDKFVQKIDTTGLHSNESSVWFIPNEVYYVAGNGIFKKVKNLDRPEWIALNEHPAIYKYSIRGSSENNIFVVGSFGLVSHYNGASWRHYLDKEIASFYGAWYKCSVTDNMVVAVGTLEGINGLILRGYRN